MPLREWLGFTAKKRAVLADEAGAKGVARATLPVDNAVRSHIAASDPAFPAKREAAVVAILAAVDGVARAHGFVQKPQSWAKAGPLGAVSLHLQRSRFGFEAQINLGFAPASGTARGAWEQDDFLPLGRFYTEGSLAPGALIYLDVLADAATLAKAMQVLDDRALPWLLAHLTDPDAHSLPF
jgi:hypothetical protein